MQFKKDTVSLVTIPQTIWQEIVTHCRTKLQPPPENQAIDKKAFGLLAGHASLETINITTVIPLHKNVRQVEPHKRAMDAFMAKYAVPSETPLEQRGWVADPEEIKEALDIFRGDHCQLMGTYHMHRVAWDHDRLRDEPTQLDTILGKDSRLFMFILSMVDPQNPVMRCFYEGSIDLEIPIQIV